MKANIILTILLLSISILGSQRQSREIQVFWTYSTNEVVDSFETYYMKGNANEWIKWYTIYPTNITIYNETNFTSLLPTYYLHNGTYNFVMFAKLHDLYSKPSPIVEFRLNSPPNHLPIDLTIASPQTVNVFNQETNLLITHPLSLSVTTELNKNYLLEFSEDTTNWTTLDLINGDGSVWTKFYDPHPSVLPYFQLMEIPR